MPEEIVRSRCPYAPGPAYGDVCDFSVGALAKRSDRERPNALADDVAPKAEVVELEEQPAPLKAAVDEQPPRVLPRAPPRALRIARGEPPPSAASDSTLLSSALRFAIFSAFLKAAPGSCLNSGASYHASAAAGGGGGGGAAAGAFFTDAELARSRGVASPSESDHDASTASLAPGAEDLAAAAAAAAAAVISLALAVSPVATGAPAAFFDGPLALFGRAVEASDRALGPAIRFRTSLLHAKRAYEGCSEDNHNNCVAPSYPRGCDPRHRKSYLGQSVCSLSYDRCLSGVGHDCGPTLCALIQESVTSLPISIRSPSLS